MNLEKVIQVDVEVQDWFEFEPNFEPKFLKPFKMHSIFSLQILSDAKEWSWGFSELHLRGSCYIGGTCRHLQALALIL